MRSFDSGLRNDLSNGVAKLALAWRIRRADGLTVRLTNHDRPIDWQSERFEARGAWALETATMSSGQEDGDLDVVGVVASQLIQKEDLLNGLWDEAEVEVMAFDWSRQSAPIALAAGAIERITIKGDAFVAQLGDLVRKLERPLGRVYARTCDAVLGDARCGVSLIRPEMSGGGVIDEVVSARELLVTTTQSFSDRWFRDGILISATGARFGIDADEASVTQRRVRLSRMAYGLAPGQVVSLVAGCDKTIATCAAKFANAINFRGFPHMPGPDATLSGAPGGGELR